MFLSCHVRTKWLRTKWLWVRVPLQNKKWSDNSEVVWWSNVSDYSFEKTLWGVFMRLCDLKYQTTRQSEFSRSLSNYVINEQLPKDP